MPVIIIPKNKGLPLFPNKKSAEDYLTTMGKDPKNYDIKYIYDTMARHNYPPSYKELHKKAARNWYQRNKGKISTQRHDTYKKRKKENG